MNFFTSRIPVSVTLLISGLMTGFFGANSYFSPDRSVLDPSLFRMTVLFGSVMLLHSIIQILGAYWFFKGKEAGFYIASIYAVLLIIMIPTVYFRTGDSSIFLIDGIRGGILCFFVLMYTLQNKRNAV